MLASTGKIVGNTAPFAVTLYPLNHDLWSRYMICEPVNIDGSLDVKRCSRCHEIKPASAFSKRSDRKSGLQSRCKSCDVEYRAERPKKVLESYPDFKTCNKCNQNLPSSDFNKKSDSSDGLGHTCRACERLRHERRAATPKKIVEAKVCSACGDLKAISEFSLHKYMVDGHSSICKKCDAQAHKDIALLEKIVPEFKKCAKCDQTKAANEFGPCATRRDGLQYMCYECGSQHARKRRNENPEKVAAKSREYRQRYPDRHCAQVSKRRAAKYRATPPWITDDHKKEINFLYWFSNAINGLHGKSYQVDHVHALRGKNFSGLHVPWNMQVIPSSINARKSNNVPANEIDVFWNFTKKQLEKFYGVK
jgi:hypothetical protein